LFFPGGVGGPDTEGVTFAGASSAGIYASVERDNNNSGVIRNTVGRIHPDPPGSSDQFHVTVASLLFQPAALAPVATSVAVAQTCPGT